MNVPRLRFKEFSGEWKETLVLDFAPLQRGFDLPVSTIVNGKFPVVFSNGILKHHHEYKAAAPGVVTGRSGTIGNVTYVEENYWPHNTSLWVTDFKNNFPKFVYYFYIKFDLARFGTGSGVPTLNRNDVHSQKVFIPTLPEQTKIANFLTTVDEKIAQLTQKGDLLALYKKGVMQQIFSQQLRFKDDGGREFPEWVEKSLGEITVSISNGLSSIQNSNKEGYKVTRIETISDKSINLNKVGYVLTDEDISSYKLEIGSILLSNINSISHIGKVVYVDADYNIYHGMNLLRIEINSYFNDSKFIFYQLSSERLKTNFETIANKAVNQASINQTELKKTLLKVPSKPEQTKIANFLTALDDKINHNQTQLNALKQYKQGLLQQMFV